MYDVHGRLEALSDVADVKELQEVSINRDKFILGVAADIIIERCGMNCALPDCDNCSGDCRQCVSDYLYDRVEKAYGEEREEHRWEMV